MYRGLEDRPRSGPPARILSATIDKIVRITTRENHVAATHWSIRTLAEVTNATHKTPEGMKWLAKHERFHLHFTSTNCSQLICLYLEHDSISAFVTSDSPCKVSATGHGPAAIPQ